MFNFKKLATTAAAVLGGTTVGVVGLGTHSAEAALLVEQWQNAGGAGLVGADATIANRPADFSQVWEGGIDFADYDFNGEFAGRNPWPLATSLQSTNPVDSANNNFAARISGFINITTSDFYSFKTLNDDGVRLRVNGNTLITDNGYHPAWLFVNNIFLDAGLHALELIYFEGDGGSVLEFSVAQGNGPFSLVGAGGLATSVTAAPTAVPTPALLPGLIGLGAAALRKRKGETTESGAEPIKA